MIDRPRRVFKQSLRIRHSTTRDGVELARPRRGGEFTHRPFLAARYGPAIQKWKIIPAHPHRSAGSSCQFSF
jgi:hypothetical protein